jgi:hypothetical protein
MLVNYFIDFLLLCDLLFSFYEMDNFYMYLVMHFWNDFDDFLPDFTNEHIIYII